MPLRDLYKENVLISGYYHNMFVKTDTKLEILQVGRQTRRLQLTVFSLPVNSNGQDLTPHMSLRLLSPTSQQVPIKNPSRDPNQSHPSSLHECIPD